jgi:hypothetical protein
VGVAEPDSARLEAVAPFGRPLFTFVARDGRGTLLLTRPDRVVPDEDPADLLETVTGIPLAPQGLLAALTGCTTEPAVEQARQIGDEWRVIPDGSAQLYFRRSTPAEHWRLQVALHQETGRGDWRAEYHDHGPDGLPQTLRLASGDGAFDLRLALSQIETNVPLDAAAFEIDVPAGAEQLTLEQLQRGAVLSEAVDEDAGAP